MTDINFKLLGPKLSRVFLVSCLKPYVYIVDEIPKYSIKYLLELLDIINKYGKGEISLKILQDSYEIFYREYTSNIHNIKVSYKTTHPQRFSGLKMFLLAIDEVFMPSPFSARRSYCLMNGALCMIFRSPMFISEEHNRQKLIYKRMLETKRNISTAKIRDTPISEIKRQLLIEE